MLLATNCSHIWQSVFGSCVTSSSLGFSKYLCCGVQVRQSYTYSIFNALSVPVINICFCHLEWLCGKPWHVKWNSPTDYWRFRPWCLFQRKGCGCQSNTPHNDAQSAFMGTSFLHGYSFVTTHLHHALADRHVIFLKNWY